MDNQGSVQATRPFEMVDTVVIGGGQAGLSIGYELKQRGIECVILDASERVGDAWRSRWDSLRLFTPARMNWLPGMAFPAPGNTFIGKEEMADFLESYAKTMELPVKSGVEVSHLTTSEDGFSVTTSEGTIAARSVVVAMANYQKPKVPAFAGELDPGIVQLHSSAYKNPSQLQDGPVLVVGLGNSGADISYEVAQSHPTMVAGKPEGAIPFKIEGWFGRHIGTRLVRFAMVSVLNTSTPIGRKARPKLLHKGPPLVRIRPKELAQAGVERVGRITGAENGKPVTADGQALNVANVIWCTGYEPGFDWIDIPIFDESGAPRHRRGIVEEAPGLYFLGLYFLHAVWSETVTGLQPDVRYLVRHIARERAAAVPA